MDKNKSEMLKELAREKGYIEQDIVGVRRSVVSEAERLIADFKRRDYVEEDAATVSQFAQRMTGFAQRLTLLNVYLWAKRDKIAVVERVMAD